LQHHVVGLVSASSVEGLIMTGSAVSGTVAGQETAKELPRGKFRPFASAWLPIIVGYLPIIALLGGGLFTLGKYLDEKTTEEIKNHQARQIELQRPFIERQSNLFFETARVIGKLMTTNPGSEWNALERRYWELYYSELAMVEPCEVDQAMAEFADALKKYKTETTDENREELGENAIAVAHALRSGMAETWSGRLPRECEDDEETPADRKR
jgi:hypothetical protein